MKWEAEMKVGNTVIYLNEGEEIEAIVEFIIGPAVDPVADPNIDLSNFNAGLIGGGVRDEESYLISIPGKNYRDGAPRKKRQLLWPRLSHIAVPVAPVTKAKKPKK